MQIDGACLSRVVTLQSVSWPPAAVLWLNTKGISKNIIPFYSLYSLENRGMGKLGAGLKHQNYPSSLTGDIWKVTNFINHQITDLVFSFQVKLSVTQSTNEQVLCHCDSRILLIDVGDWWWSWCIIDYIYLFCYRSAYCNALDIEIVIQSLSLQQ